MREEFAEHECVVGFGVVFGKSDVFVHVECHDMFESDRWVNVSIFGNSAVTYESLPSFTSEIRCLYVGIGDEPVGRPSTKGFSAVGLKSFILENRSWASV